MRCATKRVVKTHFAVLRPRPQLICCNPSSNASPAALMHAPIPLGTSNMDDVAGAAPPPPPLRPALTRLTQPHFTSVDAFEGDPPPLSLVSTCSTQRTAASFTSVYAFDGDPSLSLHRRVWRSLTASSCSTETHCPPFTGLDIFDPTLHWRRHV